MAVGSKNLETQSFTAASAMTSASAQFCVVKLVATGVCPCDANTDVPVGVLQNSPGLGEPAIVALAGQTKLRAAGTDIAAGARVASDSTGRAVTVVAGTSTGFYPVGQVLFIDATVNAGGLVSAVIDCRNPSRNL
jgi:hypothetical protein